MAILSETIEQLQITEDGEARLAAAIMEHLGVDQGRSLAWQQEALCNGLEPEMFIPDPERNVYDEDACLALCRQCTVRQPCASYALKYDGQLGVIAGTTESQRSWLSCHRDKALRVALECSETGVDTDELADWYEAAGPAGLSPDDRSMTATQAASQYGVSLATLHRWFRDRGFVPEKPHARAVEYEQSPCYRAIYVYLAAQRTNKNGGWVPQSSLVDELEKEVDFDFIANRGITMKRGPRAMWNSLSWSVVQSGIANKWIEQVPDSDNPGRNLVRMC